MKAPQVLTEDQRDSLLRAPSPHSKWGIRDRAFLNLMVYGGLPIVEACKLRKDEIYTDKYGKMRLTFINKDGNLKTVNLPMRAAHAIERQYCRAKSEYLFKGNLGGCLSIRQGYTIVVQHAAKAGMPSFFRPHSLRHSYQPNATRRRRF